MPNSIPPGNPPDIYTMIFTIMENLGRTTQMVADTRDTTDAIRGAQQTSIIKLTQLESGFAELNKDHSELRASTILHEARTTALEEKNRKRAWVIGTIVTLGSLAGSGVWWIILNWETIQRVMQHGSAAN